MNYPNFEETPIRTRLSLLNWLIVFLALACIVVILFIFFGYGTLRFTNVPPGGVIRVNGHTVSSSDIRVLPGTYHIAISSSAITPYETSVSVTPFVTATVRSANQSRLPFAVFSSVIGAGVNTSAPPKPSNARWFENDTWLVGSTVPDNNVIALRYDASSSSWLVAYATFGINYQHNAAQLPADIAAYGQQLEAGNE